MPVPVKGGEAAAESARRTGPQLLTPLAAEAFADGWVADDTLELGKARYLT